MSIKIKPQGKKLIALPLKTENFVTKHGLEIVDTVLAYAKVVEVSDELSDVYTVGDIIQHPVGSGVGIFYNKEHSLYIRQDEIWGIVTEIDDKKASKK
jgi:hypothetical protein